MYHIIKNHPEYLVVDKSPDVSVHREPGESEGLVHHIKSDLQLPELYLCHRLDKMTSGVMVLAKTEQANRELSAQFRERQTEKLYMALSAKKPKKKQGTVRGDMEKSRRGAWRLLRSQHNPAITQFFSKGLGDGLRLFLLRPITGKTHQLRVALKSIGSPILGDSLYGSADTDCDRGYLHAWQLSFSWQGQPCRYRAWPTQGRFFHMQAFSNEAEWLEAKAQQLEPEPDSPKSSL